MLKMKKQEMLPIYDIFLILKFKFGIDFDVIKRLLKFDIMPIVISKYF